jgi:hypothetical protein
MRGWETLSPLVPLERGPMIEFTSRGCKDCGCNAYGGPWDRKMDAVTSILATISKLMFIYAISI